MHYVDKDNMKELLEKIAKKIGKLGTLKNWKPSTKYEEEDLFVYEGQIYVSLVGIESDITFNIIEILEEYTPIAWEANHSYSVNDIFEESGTLYKVVTAFTSSSTFSVTSDIEEYIPKAYVKGTEVITGELVSYNDEYYKAINNFICGEVFTTVAFEKYVPKPLTDEQVQNSIANFNPFFDGALGFVVYENAGAHNALYRGENITDYFESGIMSEEIANGTFRNIFPGDYIIKSVTINGTTYEDVKWIVGDLDYFLNSGDIACITHHVLMFPETCIGSARMNASNTVSGGYVGSEMWTTTIPLYVIGIQNAFGNSHILSHRELLTNAVSSGHSSGVYSYDSFSSDWSWEDVLVNIFNENMLYGSAQLSSSGYDTGNSLGHVSAFAKYRPLTNCANHYWLRSVFGGFLFVFSHRNGQVDGNTASEVVGVRPYFLLY